MPAILDIEEGGHLFVLRLIDPWTMEDLFTTYPRALAHLNNGESYKVYTLVDLTQMKMVARNALQGRTNPFVTHRRNGQVVVVGASQFARVIVEAALRIARVDNVRFENDMATARSFLKNILAQDNRALSSIKGD